MGVVLGVCLGVCLGVHVCEGVYMWVGVDVYICHVVLVLGVHSAHVQTHTSSLSLSPNPVVFPCTHQELHEAQQQQHQKQRVPRGTSAYQAAWLLDGEDYGTDLESQEEEEEEKGNEEGGYGGYGGGNGGGGLSGRKNMGSGVPQGVPLVEEESMWEPMDDGGTDVMQVCVYCVCVCLVCVCVKSVLGGCVLYVS